MVHVSYLQSGRAYCAFQIKLEKKIPRKSFSTSKNSFFASKTPANLQKLTKTSKNSVRLSHNRSDSNRLPNEDDRDDSPFLHLNHVHGEPSSHCDRVQTGFGQGADASGTLGEAPPGAGGFEAPSDHTKNQDTSGDLDLARALSASLNEDRGSKRTRGEQAEEDSEDPNTKMGCG